MLLAQLKDRQEEAEEEEEEEEREAQVSNVIVILSSSIRLPSILFIELQADTPGEYQGLRN